MLENQDQFRGIIGERYPAKLAVAIERNPTDPEPNPVQTKGGRYARHRVTIELDRH